MNNHNELMNFFEVFITLRYEYAQSNDPFKLEKISCITQVAVEVIKCGEIPRSFRTEHLMPYDFKLLIEPVKELFNRLSIELESINKCTSSIPAGQLCYVIFTTY